jgi:hypothetical protein
VAQRRTVGLVLAGLGVGLLIGVPGVNAANRILFADNAGAVRGIEAARKPRANMLVPLNAKGEFSAKVIPNVTRLRGGQTVTGVIGGTFTAQAPGDTFSSTASLYPAAPREVATETTGIDNTSFENPFCEGSVEKPTAPQGLLCIYLATEQLVNVTQDCRPGPFPNCTAGEGGFIVSREAVWGGQNGFGLRWTAAAKGLTTLYASWAYTAPIKGQQPGAIVGGGAGDD